MTPLDYLVLAHIFVRNRECCCESLYPLIIGRFCLCQPTNYLTNSSPNFNRLFLRNVVESEKHGKFPDYRFTLANERTFLAWIRTALAFMAAAIGIDQLAPELAPASVRGSLVTILGMTAAGLAYYAWRRWATNESAMWHDLALPFPRVLIWLSSGLSVGVTLTLIVMIAL
ncbi:DUF202 domain-containing protein [Salmonella enterica subsp. salamae]|uniref:DUF202 domain-containing protein n=1 Tax=Salmonella enterica subsp. salamae TaxID=59202 RepID=A0A5Y3X8M3_SALER|nr:DUF202 domain-containing protein [Salmonella enterica subsp. salamae]ECJ4506039.1 hypothetical protein [Salmonella enterica subsp. salamae]EDN4180215.1 DUF202 domain-containing protein [Salmonella enterica subsp. salamae]